MTNTCVQKCEPERSQETRPVYKPAMDVVEREDAFVLRLDMPGVDEKNVDIELDNGTLTVKGQRVAEEEKDHETLYQGYRSGNYERAFRLGDGLDLENIKAQMKNGVLRLTLAKVPEAVPKKIKITSE